MTTPLLNEIIWRLLDEAPWLSDAAIAEVARCSRQWVQRVRAEMGRAPAKEWQRVKALQIVKGMR